MKHSKVEVYLLEFKLCIHPKLNEHIVKPFSRADSISMFPLSLPSSPFLPPTPFLPTRPFPSLPPFLPPPSFPLPPPSLPPSPPPSPLPPSPSTGDLEKELRSTFDVAEGTVCRVWHRYMSHTYELLSDSKQTLQDAGLYNMQVLS